MRPPTAPEARPHLLRAALWAREQSHRGFLALWCPSSGSGATSLTKTPSCRDTLLEASQLATVPPGAKAGPRSALRTPRQGVCRSEPNELQRQGHQPRPRSRILKLPAPGVMGMSLRGGAAPRASSAAHRRRARARWRRRTASPRCKGRRSSTWRAARRTRPSPPQGAHCLAAAQAPPRAAAAARAARAAPPPSSRLRASYRGRGRRGATRR